MLKWALDLFFPAVCGICGEKNKNWLCSKCKIDIEIKKKNINTKVYLKYYEEILFIFKANKLAATATDIKSDTGSAKNTANTLSAKKFGKMNINGINKIIFLRHAINNDSFACPNETKVCCTAI